jgi:hypothetical protein
MSGDYDVNGRHQRQAMEAAGATGAWYWLCPTGPVGLTGRSGVIGFLGAAAWPVVNAPASAPERVH